MSNIYIQEPPTNGKVLLVTSVGDIDIELWSKEAPKACRNFIQLCMEGYYDGTLFHRVVPEFIVQGGDPTGTGSGGESIYGHPFKDEIHSRLRFVRRGLVGMANAGLNDNSSQFFFTMGSTPELMNKHTIFGKVAGNTIYNMLKLQECETGPNDRPIHPHRIIRCQILSNPFEDIIPRVTKKKKEHDGEKKAKSKSKATKNFKLLSFGEEAEEDEEQVTKVSEGWKGKSKSSHDLANDPKLSAVPALDVPANKLEKKLTAAPAVDVPPSKVEKKPSFLPTLDVPPSKVEKKLDPFPAPDPPQIKAEKRPAASPEIAAGQTEEEKEEQRESVRKKLKKEPEEKIKKPKPIETPEIKPDIKPVSKSDELKKEAKQLKKEIKESKRREEQRKAGVTEEKTGDDEDEVPVLASDPLSDFKRERQKYKALRKQQGKKGLNREEITLSILDKFKSKLNTVKTLAGEYADDEETIEEEEEMDTGDLSWLNHKLQFEDQSKKVLDANITDVDRYEIFDPRNPLAVRRREASKQAMKQKR